MADTQQAGAKGSAMKYRKPLMRLPAVLWLLSSLPLLALLHYSTEALEDFYHFERSQGFPVKLDIDRFHFHLKRVIMGDIIKRRSSSLPAESKLPAYYITLAEDDIQQLNSDLPRSGREQYITGFIRKGLDSEPIKAEFRYRGGMPNHWLYEQKSFRVKLPKYTTLDGVQRFNLINPPDASICRDCISYDLARQYNLLTPEYHPIRLFLNNEYRGVYIYLSQVDESFLRKNQRMPGSLYDGDLLYGDVVRGNKLVFAAYSEVNKEGDNLLWTDPMVWGKSGARNREQEKDRRDLQRFLEVINSEDPATFYRQFRYLFNAEKFYALFALDNYFGTHHRDLAHNHKLYFDPYQGQFEPIAWDLRYWNSALNKDTSTYPLLTQVALNPILEFERDQYAYQMLNNHPADEIVTQFQQYADTILPDLQADIYRDRVIDQSALKTQHAVPLTLIDFDIAIKRDSGILKRRYKILQAIYASQQLRYQIHSESTAGFNLRFAVSGNSPADIDLSKFIQSSGTPRFYRDLNHDGLPQPEEQMASPLDRLYPGRRHEKANHLTSKDRRQRGDTILVPATLTYDYIILNASPKRESVEGNNAITGQPTKVTEIEIEAEPEEPADSVHPWLLPDQLAPPPSPITLSGVIPVQGKQVFDHCSKVQVMPGTHFQLEPGASLIFYCPLMAQGTAENPIRFTRSPNSTSPWHSVVIQGNGASGSQLQHIEVNGGSLVRHNLVNYPGQFNIHGVTDFSISQARFSDNLTGDDNLHIAYSTGKVENSLFLRSNMDALDIDISEVAIRDTAFIDNGNDGIDLMTSQATLDGILVSHSGDKCISAGEESLLTATRTLADNCQIGLAIKDRTKAILEDMSFSNQRGDSIALYNKNPRYSEGGEVIIRKVSGITKSAINADKRSKVSIQEDATFNIEVHWENLQILGLHSKDELQQHISSLRKTDQ